MGREAWGAKHGARRGRGYTQTTPAGRSRRFSRRGPPPPWRSTVRTIVKGKNLEVPDAVRQYAERKMRRLERFLDDRTEAILEISIEHHRSTDDSRIAEVTLVIDGQALRGRADAVTYEAAIDEVVDKVERRAVDHREKPRNRARGPEEKCICLLYTSDAADE